MAATQWYSVVLIKSTAAPGYTETLRDELTFLHKSNTVHFIDDPNYLIEVWTGNSTVIVVVAKG